MTLIFSKFFLSERFFVQNFLNLSILTGKNTQIKLLGFGKMWKCTFRSLVHQINSLYEVLNLKQNFPENQVATGKNFLLFCKVHFVIRILFVSRLAFDRANLYRYIAFSLLVLSTKKLLKRICVFQKICFKVKILKMSKISSDCHIKTCWTLKRRAIKNT